MSAEEQHALLVAENQELRAAVSKLRTRVSELEDEVVRLTDAKNARSQAVIDLESDSESKPQPAVTKRWEASSFDDSASSTAVDQIITNHGTNPRASKKPRMKVEVVIERPSPRVRKREKLKPSITPKIEIVEDSKVPEAQSEQLITEGSVNDEEAPRRDGEDAWALAAAALTAKPKGETHAADEGEISNDIETPDGGIETPLDIDEPPELDFEARSPSDASKPSSVKPEPKKTLKLDIKKDIDLDAETVQSRINAIGSTPFPITLDPALRDVPVSRVYMSAMYGGNSIETFPPIGEEMLAKYGFNDFCYITLEYNPSAPTEPGHPGLWFNSSPNEQEHPTPYRTFVRLRATQWLYVGQYQFIQSPYLSQAEWVMQAKRVQNMWSRKIRSKNWGKLVRTRVTLRRDLRREPRPDELRTALASQKTFQEISEEEILAAYNKGEEHLGIVAMKCVGYDEEFQRRIAGEYPIWAADRKDDADKQKGRKRKAKRQAEGGEDEDEEKGSGGGDNDDVEILDSPPKRAKRARKTVGMKKGKGRATKRRADVEDTDDDDDDDDDERRERISLANEEDGNDVVFLLPSMSRGTRRPSIPMSSVGLQALLDAGRDENRELRTIVGQLRTRVSQLEGEVARLTRTKVTFCFLWLFRLRASERAIDLRLDSDHEDNLHRRSPLITKKRPASSFDDPVPSIYVSSNLNPDDPRIRAAKEPRMKVEVVIERPSPRTHKQAKLKASPTLQIGMYEQSNVPIESERVISEQLVVEEQSVSGSSRSPDSEGIPKTEEDRAYASAAAALTAKPKIESAQTVNVVETTNSNIETPLDLDAPSDPDVEADPLPKSHKLPKIKSALRKTPKIEIKKGIDFDAETTRSRIDAIGRTPFPVTLDPALRDVSVSRAYMSTMYGGSSQRTFPSIGTEKLEKHGLNDFCYISLMYNPVGPREAGHPGLWFDTRPFNLTGAGKDAKRMFVRLRANAWLYVGQYQFSASPGLSQTEWLLQSTQVCLPRLRRSARPWLAAHTFVGLPMKVQNTWAREIWRHNWGYRVRVRVTLRRDLQHEPTPEEVEQAVKTEKAFQDITTKDIVAAYNKGEEHLYIAGMKCVGYDEAFQRKIAEGFPKWVAPPTKEKRPKGKDAREKNGKKGRGPKRRTGSSEDDGEDDEEVNGKDVDEVVSANSGPKGIRKKHGKKKGKGRATKRRIDSEDEDTEGDDNGDDELNERIVGDEGDDDGGEFVLPSVLLGTRSRPRKCLAERGLGASPRIVSCGNARRMRGIFRRRSLSRPRARLVLLRKIVLSLSHFDRALSMSRLDPDTMPRQASVTKKRSASTLFDARPPTPVALDIEVDSVKPRSSKRPRMKVEVVIERPSSRTKEKGKQRASIVPKVELEEDPKVPIDPEKVTSDLVATDGLADSGEIPRAGDSNDRSVSSSHLISNNSYYIEAKIKLDIKKGLELDAATVQTRIDAIGRDPFLVTLDPAEWLLQTTKVRNAWARYIWKETWGWRNRARITFRRDEGREPTEDELRDASTAKKKFQEITWEDVRDAYDRGEERLAVSAIKCIEYDEEFQRKISADFPKWDEADRARKDAEEEQRPAKRKKGDKNTHDGHNDGTEDEVVVLEGPPQRKKNTHRGAGKNKGKGRAAKRRAEVESSEDDEGDGPKYWDLDDEDDESDGMPALKFMSQGTRSRPRRSV
ncbi:hypothetical protein EVG20_g8158 [Dentipellis fragilis]|uniref:DUF6697 domain-containing protein n=1 Tax=Dentipellis fragilis TaxID=205917 RepID=A0A4Y9YAE0_9AGAM|nr:hypothetical protein EVG20_g8158 [Dentipellis fragilis]